MQFLQQLKKRVWRLIKYAFVYTAIAILIIFSFSTIYYMLGIENPYQMSEDIFWGIAATPLLESIRYIGILQIVVKDTFFIVWIGSLLSKFLTPLNPLFFSKYVVFCDGCFKFRYWIMLPAHNFLYDIHIRVFLSDGPLYNGGVNRLQADWELKDSNIQHIDLARGVHFVSLSKEDSYLLLSKINKIERKGGDARLIIMIHGHNQNGLMFRGQHSYSTEKHLKKGYRYVSIRQSECVDVVNSILCDNPFVKDNKLIRYQNFDKIYMPLPTSRLLTKKQLEKKPNGEKDRDVFTYMQVAEGQYRSGIRQKLLDATNRIISLYLDKNAQFDFRKSNKE